MAISAKMLQYRGAYENFNPTVLLPGQFAVVLSGDPSTVTGKSLYMCFEAGQAKRILADDDAMSSVGGFVAQSEPPEDTSVLWVDLDDETSEEVEIPEVDLSNYYTKEEVDALIPDGVDLGEYYKKTETYSRDEIDVLLANIESYADAEGVAF